MRHWVLMLFAAALAVAAIGCERTIREPGEPEHGGVFLHGSPHAEASTRRFFFF